MKKGLVFLVVVAVIVLGVVSAQLYANHALRTRVDDYSRSLAGAMDMKVDKVWMDLLRMDAHLEGVAIDSLAHQAGAVPTILVDKAVVYEYDVGNRIPHYTHMKVQGIHMPLSMPADADQDLAQFGLTRGDLAELTLDTETEYRFEPGTKELHVNRNRVLIRGWGTVSARAELANLDLAALDPESSRSTDPFAVLGVLSQVQLVSLDVELNLVPMADRVMEGAAKNQGVSVAEIRNQIADKARADMAGDPEFSPFLAGIIEDFIRQPGVIRVMASPERPVSVMEIVLLSERSDLLLELLNLKVEKN